MIEINGYEVKFGKFPNGEMNLQVETINDSIGSNCDVVCIELEYENDDELFKLLCLKRFIDEARVCKCILYLNYMPYSRMDRRNDSYVSALKYVCEMINSMNFHGVVVIEPHSDVTTMLLNNCRGHNWCEEKVFFLMNNANINTLFYPDAGAQKRYSFPFPHATGQKERDFKAGEIINFSINGTVGENVLIVDDICSRGGTFINASIHLKKAGAKNVSLLVAHCEENVFTGELFNHIDVLYTRPRQKLSEHKQIRLI